MRNNITVFMPAKRVYNKIGTGQLLCILIIKYSIKVEASIIESYWDRPSALLCFDIELTQR